MAWIAASVSAKENQFLLPDSSNGNHCVHSSELTTFAMFRFCWQCHYRPPVWHILYSKGSTTILSLACWILVSVSERLHTNRMLKHTVIRSSSMLIFEEAPVTGLGSLDTCDMPYACVRCAHSLSDWPALKRQQLANRAAVYLFWLCCAAWDKQDREPAKHGLIAPQQQSRNICVIQTVSAADFGYTITGRVFQIADARWI